MDSHRRSFAKALSWRITGTLDTILLSYLITGSAKLAMSIGTTEIATKALLYYLQERAWLKIPFGREVAKALPPAPPVQAQA